MSQLTKQQRIVQLFKGKESLTFNEIALHFEQDYYCNHKHYVSEILSGMVKNKRLKRVKKGIYELISPNFINPNQISIFDYCK